MTISMNQNDFMKGHKIIGPFCGLTDIWLKRNKRVFRSMESSWSEVWVLARSNTYLWVSVIKDFSDYHLSLILMSWRPCM